jgi:ABC-type multidrug transport system permease subunit
MLTTFITTIKVLVRESSVLMWAIAFPLILSTLFYAMFSNLDEAYKLEPIAVVIVNDANYREAPALDELLTTLVASDANDGSPLLSPTFVSNAEEALAKLEDGFYYGYIAVDAAGLPTYQMDARRIDSLATPTRGISQNIVVGVLNRYVQQLALIEGIAQNSPQLLGNAEFINSVLAEASFTERASVTANPPSDALRYFYAVLAFSVIMMATFALAAVDMVQGNTSPLGARRSLGGQSKLRTLAPTLAAAWLLSFACVLLGFAYQRFVFGVDFGGNEAAVVLTLAVSTLAITFLGALFGALPLQIGIKSGLVAFASCIFSLFAGLYGTFSQDLGDYVARELPWLSACNPARQVADAFFSLYYYDGYERLGQCLVSLLVFGAVFFIVSTLIMRRQRYASL